jgi:hypothetical protein
MKGRYGWMLVLVVVVSWDLVAAMTNGETLTWTFRRAVAHTAWRWPILAVVLLLLVHLFLPQQLTKYDPLDRLYQRLDPVAQPKRPPLRQPVVPGADQPQS